MYPQQRKPIRPYIVRGVILLAVVGVFGYIATHGRLDISKTSSETVVVSRYSESLSNTPEYKTGSSHILSSGEYSIATSLVDDGLFVQQVDIPHFLQSFSAQNNSRSSKTSVLARNSNENIAIINGKVVSYDSTGNIRTPVPNNITNQAYSKSFDRSFPDFEYFKQISSSTVAGFVSSSTGQQPAIYDLSTSSVTFFPLIKSSGRYVSLSPDYGVFSALDTKKRELHTYNTKSGTESIFKLGGELSISSIGSRALFSSVGKHVAVVGGRSFEDTNDARKSIDGGDQVVYVFDTATNTRVFKKSFGSTVITGIVLSKSSDKIAIQTLSQTAVYSVSSGDLLYTLPFPTSQLLWIDGSRFIAQTPENSIFIADGAAKTAKTLVPYSSVRPSKISFIDNGLVYFTGFSESIPGVAGSDIYSSEFDSEATQRSTNALTKFPYQGEGFYVDVLNNTPIVQLTRYRGLGKTIVDNTAKQAASSHVRENLGADAVGDIVYTYIIFDY